MGVVDLVSAFNAVAGDAFTCQRATLGYTRAHDTEWQILTFYGTDALGVPFERKSDPVRPDGDVIVAARETAQLLLDQAAAAAAKASKGNLDEPA